VPEVWKPAFRSLESDKITIRSYPQATFHRFRCLLIRLEMKAHFEVSNTSLP